MSFKAYNRFLDTTGDGTGTKNAIGNYSSSAEEFLLTPGGTVLGEQEIIQVNQLNIFIKTTNESDAKGYGSDTELTNGITLLWRRKGVTFHNLTDSVPIKTAVSWLRYSDYDIVRELVPKGHVYKVIIKFETFGQPPVLMNRYSDSLVVQLNDDFSHLTEHYFLARGIYRGDI